MGAHACGTYFKTNVYTSHFGVLYFQGNFEVQVVEILIGFLTGSPEHEKNFNLIHFCT